MQTGDLIYALPDTARPCGLNPRERFDDEKQQELEDSIAEEGVLEPILASSLLNDFLAPGGDGWPVEVEFLVVAGERRWRAAMEMLPDEEIPFLVRDDLTPEVASRLVLVENVQRADLSAVEEARGLQRWQETTEYTQELMAVKLSKSQAWVSNRLRLLQLPDDVLTIIQDGVITATQARDLLLPFQAIGYDDERAAFYDAVLERIDKQGGPLTPAMVGTLVQDVARERSRALEGSYWSKAHEACGCGAPGGRCFNIDWWEANKPVDVSPEAEEQGVEPVPEEPGEILDLDDLPWGSPDTVLEAVDTEQHFGTNPHRRLVHIFDGRTTVADPALLDPDDLLLVELPHGGEYAVLCRDWLAVRDAREEASRVLGMRRDGVERRRVERDLAELGEHDLLIPGFIARAFTITDPNVDAFLELARNLGLPALPDLPDPADDPDGWTDELVAWMEALEPEGLGQILQVWALRVGRGDYDPHHATAVDPAREEATVELHEEYLVELKGIFPFEIPGVEEDEEPDDIMTEEDFRQRIQEWVADPDLATSTIMHEAAQLAPAFVEGLSARQFTARYILPARRALRSEA